jgi:hypothetical protein
MYVDLKDWFVSVSNPDWNKTVWLGEYPTKHHEYRTCPDNSPNIRISNKTP